MAADLAEILALIMSSKSAQYEFCVDDSQKSWLGNENTTLHSQVNNFFINTYSMLN